MSIASGFVSLISKRVKNSKASSSRLEKFSLVKPLPMKLDYLVDHFLYQLDFTDQGLACAFLILENFADEMDLWNIHKLVFTSLVISYKFFIDKPVKNSDLEKIGVIRRGTLSELEKSLLDIIDWDLKISNFETVLKNLSQEGRKIILETETGDVEEEYDNEDMMDCDTNESLSEIGEFFFTRDLNDAIFRDCDNTL